MRGLELWLFFYTIEVIGAFSKMRSSMEILWEYAVAAGLIGTALMTVAIVAGKLMGLASDMVRILGLAFVSEEHPRRVYGVGLIVHFAFGALFGILYAVALTAVGAAGLVGMAAAWGAVFGALHGVAVGGALGALPVVHPRMGSGQVLQPPGFFGRDIGVGMPVALILLHIIYGVTAGVVYSVGVLS